MRGAAGWVGGGLALGALAGCPPNVPPPKPGGEGTGSGTGAGTKSLAPMAFDGTAVSISMGKGAEPIPLTVSGRIEASPDGAMKGEAKVAFPNGKTVALVFAGMQATASIGGVKVGIAPGAGVLVNGEVRTLGTADLDFTKPLASMGDLELALLGVAGVASTPSFSQNARDIRAGLIILAATGFWCKAAVVACAVILAAAGVAACAALVAGCVGTVEIPVIGIVTCKTAEGLCAAIAAGVGKGIEYLIEYAWGNEA